MPGKKRINVQKDVIEHCSLKQMIHDWFVSHLEAIGSDFEVCVRRMKELQTQFQQKCLQYTIMRRMPWIISNLEQQKLVQLNQQLKINYQKLIINAFFISDNAFELFIFYFVKLTTLFLKDCFNNLLIESTLQSQICIVLYYTFLGVEIKQRTYEVIKKKYQNSANKAVKLRIDQTTKISLSQSYFKQSMKMTSKKRLLKRHNSIHSRESICRPIKQSFSKDSINDISQILQQNLHVSPLPPLKERRVKIRDVERMKTQNRSQQPFYCGLLNKDGGVLRESKIKKNYLYSNQLSSSLKTLHPQQLIFELTSKKVKINQSIHDFKTNITQNSLCQLKKRKIELNQSIYKNKVECSRNESKGINDWMAIIEDLKKKVSELRSNSNNDQRKRQGQSEQVKQKPQTLRFRTSQLDTSDTFKQSVLSKHQSLHPHSQRQQISFLKIPLQQLNSPSKISYHYTQDLEFIMEEFPKKSPIAKKTTRSSLRCDQANFQNSCKARLSSFLPNQQIQSLHKECKLILHRQ